MHYGFSWVIEEVNIPETMITEELNKVSRSFKTFDAIFLLIEKGEYSLINRKCGTNDYPEVKWMIDYFIEKEDYRKCDFLSKLKLPQVSKKRLDKEMEWLTSKGL